MASTSATTLPWMSEAERRDEERLETAFITLAASVDPEDPWSHPDAATLDGMSLAEWLRTQGALPAVLRRHELASLSLACDSPERTSLLAELRKHAALGGDSFYDLERWESLRVRRGLGRRSRRRSPPRSVPRPSGSGPL